MKARPIDFDDVGGVDGAMRRIAIVRFAELLALAPALRRGRPDELHALRIACKRLRYALERFSNFEPALHAASVRLAQLQDTLGNVHDRDVLLAALPGGARNTLHRIRTQRDETVARSRALLHDAFAPYGPFEGLVHFTGLGSAAIAGNGLYGPGEGATTPD